MLKKFAAFTAVAAAAGMGLASPAHANEPKDLAKNVDCVIVDTGNTSNRSESALGLLIGSLGLSDLLSHRNVNVDCHVTHQINNNQHTDSHETDAKPGYRFRGRR